MELKNFIRDIPDFPKPGIVFKDITPLLAEPAAFAQVIETMASEYRGMRVDAIAAAEARGFLIAAPLAFVLKKPLIPLRKPGKLPFRTYSLKYELEYGSAELHVHEDGIAPTSQVLLVDDLLATGGTMRAGCDLIERAGGLVAGCAFMVELSALKGRNKLQEYDIFSVIVY
jgi:adenine phosphoribosyltransferase